MSHVELTFSKLLEFDRLAQWQTLTGSILLKKVCNVVRNNNEYTAFGPMFISKTLHRLHSRRLLMIANKPPTWNGVFVYL